jgi:hypothetical protein
MDPICGAISLLVAIPLIIIHQISKRKNDALIPQREAYQEALARLREDPTNPTLHEQALDLGRIYASSSRGNKSVTLFDETALANDIRAVTANATQTAPVISQSATTATTTSLESRINALKKMKENGLLSDEEFEQKRQEILDSI